MTSKRKLIRERNNSLVSAGAFLIGFALMAWSLNGSSHEPGWAVAAMVLLGIGSYSLITDAVKKADALKELSNSEAFYLEDRVDELERLKDEKLITADEYAACCLKLARLEAEELRKANQSSLWNQRRSVEDRLDELERLKRRDLVTPEEYAAKRQEILKDL
jgi:hypothetical protein